jgi:hypothetical protein
MDAFANDKFLLTFNRDDTEGGGIMLLRQVANYLPVYTA